MYPPLACGKCTGYSHCTCSYLDDSTTARSHQLSQSSNYGTNSWPLSGSESSAPCETAANVFTVNHQHITYNYPIYHATPAAATAAPSKSPSLPYACSISELAAYQQSSSGNSFAMGVPVHGHTQCQTVAYDSSPQLATPEPEFINYSQIKHLGGGSGQEEISCKAEPGPTIKYNATVETQPYVEDNYDYYYSPKAEYEMQQHHHQQQQSHQQFGGNQTAGHHYYESSSGYNGVSYFDTGTTTAPGNTATGNGLEVGYGGYYDHYTSYEQQMAVAGGFATAGGSTAPAVAAPPGHPPPPPPPPTLTYHHHHHHHLHHPAAATGLAPSVTH